MVAHHKLNHIGLHGPLTRILLVMISGCHNIFVFLAAQIGNKKFPVIMHYFFGQEGKLKLTGPFTAKYKSNKRYKSKEKK